MTILAIVSSRKRYTYVYMYFLTINIPQMQLPASYIEEQGTWTKLGMIHANALMHYSLIHDSGDSAAVYYGKRLACLLSDFHHM